MPTVRAADPAAATESLSADTATYTTPLVHTRLRHQPDVPSLLPTFVQALLAQRLAHRSRRLPSEGSAVHPHHTTTVRRSRPAAAEANARISKPTDNTKSVQLP